MKSKYILGELKNHLPFSIISVSMGLVLAGILQFVAHSAGSPDMSKHFGGLFHLFHPMHVLFSATATTAMFWQNERKFFKAAGVGIAGSMGICGISDIFMPYLSGLVLGKEMCLHICVLVHPQMILPFLAMGLVMGFLAPGQIERQGGVILSHSLHVFISAAASIMYLVSFGFSGWLHHVGAVMVFMVMAVIIPCCLSDIVFPLIFVNKKGSVNHFH